MDNRQIKFRAWEERTKTMHYDLIYYSDNGKAVMGKDRPLIGVILLQFTGLQDKNGKHIYEGDIIKDSTGNILVISWSKKFASFVIDRDGWIFSHWFGEACNGEDVEIIGNIYQKS